MASLAPKESFEIISAKLDEYGVGVRIKWTRSGTEWTLNDAADSVLASVVRTAAENGVEDHFRYLNSVRVSADESPTR